MGKNDDLQQKLVDRIKTRRANINTYAGNLERRSVRLTNLSIICTALTTVLVAGPAFGGETFTEGLQKILSLASDSLVWRSLCLVAMILSIAATVANNMYKSHDIASRLAKAQASCVLLEGLETSIEFGQLPMEDATRLFQQYIVEVPFIEEK